ncbi:MAG: hypothetical protein K0R51_1508 [Cytophagaceae bacterium]|jgi:hypothetical protein|nr:hypothetical protein [Cytophagaceae bacterium]
MNNNAPLIKIGSYNKDLFINLNVTESGDIVSQNEQRMKPAQKSLFVRIFDSLRKLLSPLIVCFGF